MAAVIHVWYIQRISIRIHYFLLNSEPCLKPNIRIWYLWQQLKITDSKIKPLIRVFAKAEFTNPIPQKIRRTKKYCGIPQNKDHEFHNIFKFCGTTPQIIPTHIFFRPVKYFVENRFRFRKYTTTSDSTNKIRTFFVKFRFVNSAVANTLFRVIFFYITEIRFKGQFYRSHLAVWANAVFLLYSAVPTRKL